MDKTNVWIIFLSLVLLTACTTEEPTEEDTVQSNEEAEEMEGTESTHRATIIHTNDMHGRMMEQGEDEEELGLAFIHGVYEHFQTESDEVILVDSGDTFHGTTNVHLSEGEAMVELMNEMGYFAMAAGNHEFNYGYERLIELDALADFPILASNVIHEDTEEQILEGFAKWEIFGIEIGIIGLVTDETPVRTHPSNVDGLIFENEINVAREQVDKLSDEFDSIILLTHSGYSVDQAIAEEVDGVDLIIEGHSHTAIEKPDFYEETFIAQAWEHTKGVGVIHMDFENGEIVNIEGELITDSEGFEPNEETQNLVDTIVTEVEAELKEVAGEIDTDLNGNRESVRVEETNLGNFITDAIRERTGADVAIMNSGGIRDSISQGEVTHHDVVSVLPFINLVEVQEMDGSVLLDALEHSFSTYPEENGGFLQISGMTVVADVSSEPGERVVSVEIAGQPLDESAVYTVGTNDFLAAGGDGYDMFTDQEIILSTGELLSEVLITRFENDGEIPEVEDRIIIMEQ